MSSTKPLPHGGNFIYESNGMYMRFQYKGYVYTVRLASSNGAVSLDCTDWYLKDGGTILMSIREFRKCVTEVFYDSDGRVKHEV